MPSEGVNALEFAQRLMNVIDADIRPLIAEPTPLPVQPPACRQTTLTPTFSRPEKKSIPSPAPAASATTGG